MDPNTHDDQKPVEESAEPPVVAGGSARSLHIPQFPPLFKFGLVTFVLLAGGGSYALVKFNTADKPVVVTTTAHTAASKTSAEPQATKATSKQATTDSQPKSTSQTPVAAPTTKKSASGSSSPVPQPVPAPTPWVNTTNCLPQHPSQYATYYIGMTSAQYLQTDAYINTGKLYAALQFAGLLDAVNSKQYTLLAMDDGTWSQFTQAQLDWLNASPANMRSLLGWQIIKSCITWAGVNPVESLAKGTKLTVQTLNGPLTYTAGTGYGGGTFESEPVAMWDWFTSNGSVSIAGFVKPSVVP